MGCGCGKRQRLTRRQIGEAAVTVPTGKVWWYAVPPAGSSEPEQMFRTIAEAREAARLGAGNGWMVEGRRVDITDDEA